MGKRRKSEIRVWAIASAIAPIIALGQTQVKIGLAQK